MDFEQIEDSIIAALKTEIPYLRTVETYAGQLEDELEKLPLRFPAVFVVYSGSELNWIDGPNHEEKVGFSVLVAFKDLRSSESVRKAEYGAYQMIKDVLSALTNRTFNLNMEKLRPVRVSLIHMGKTIALYSIDFQTSFDKTYEW